VAGRLRRVFVGKNVFAVVYRTDNGVLAADPEDMGVGSELRETGAYAQDELARIFQYADETTDVLVVGAHLGALVVPIARKCRRVVAIEANPHTFDLLKTNLVLNDLSNVRAHNIAASDKTEMLEFVASRNNSGGTKRMPKIRAFEYFYDKPAAFSVQAHSLDAYLKDETFSLVFMDIEGSEYFALKGMQRILQGARTLFVEFLPHHLRNVSGVSPSEFLAPVQAHFNRLLIPSKGREVDKADFLPVLQSMFDRDEGDDGLIFIK
jgi:FkbM family methyltransferase